VHSTGSPYSSSGVVSSKSEVADETTTTYRKARNFLSAAAQKKFPQLTSILRILCVCLLMMQFSS
jgi:hypothetical protein